LKASGSSILPKHLSKLKEFNTEFCTKHKPRAIYL